MSFSGSKPASSAWAIGDGYPKTFSGSTVAPRNFLCTEKNIVFASDTALTVCNPTGKELLNTQHSYASPAVRASGTRVLLYNLGGKDAEVETVGGGTVKLSVGQNILGGALAANGRSALISAADGYCGMLTAYDAAGKVLSYYWFSDYYPTAVALSPDGTKAAVTGVSAKDGGLVSAVYLISLAQRKNRAAGSRLHRQYAERRFLGHGPHGYCGRRHGRRVPRHRFRDENGLQLRRGAADGVLLRRRPSCPRPDAVRRFPTTRSSLCSALRGARHTPRNSGEDSFRFALRADRCRPVGRQGIFRLSFLTASAVQECDAGSDACAVALKDESSAYVLGISEVRSGEYPLTGL